MISYANNPQAVINGFYSSSRNVFLTVSIGIAMYGFSDSFKIGGSKHIVKDISLLILIFSVLLGINNILLFNNYIKGLENDKKNGNKLPLYVDLNSWRRFLYLKIYIVVLICCIVCAGLIRLFNIRIFS